MIRPLRKYEPIWLRLKDREIAKLEVLPYRVARVRKAISKEKDMDLGFKVSSPDWDSYILSFEYDEDSGIMTVELKRRIGDL